MGWGTSWSFYGPAEEALHPECAVENADGSTVPVSCRDGIEHVRGTRHPASLRVRALCQADVRVPIPTDGSELDLSSSAPETTRMYLRPDGHVLVPDIDHPLTVEFSREVNAPQNTVIEVFRPWPNLSGLCDLVLARIVDAGGATYRGFGASASPMPRALAGLEVFVRSADLSPTLLEGAAASEVIDTARADAAEAAAAAARAESEAELASGRCSDRRHAVLEELLARDTVIARGMDGVNGIWTLVGHEYVVARPEGVDVAFTATISGEYHVFAVGPPPVVLQVVDRDGYAVTRVSDFETVFGAPDDTSDSRVVDARVREVFRASVRGQGCTLVLAFARD